MVLRNSLKRSSLNVNIAAKIAKLYISWWLHISTWSESTKPAHSGYTHISARAFTKCAWAYHTRKLSGFLALGMTGIYIGKHHKTEQFKKTKKYKQMSNSLQVLTTLCTFFYGHWVASSWLSCFLIAFDCLNKLVKNHSLNTLSFF